MSRVDKLRRRLARIQEKLEEAEDPDWKDGYVRLTTKARIKLDGNETIERPTAR